jgi:hypothetical protein
MSERENALATASVAGADVGLHATVEHNGAVRCELECNGRAVIVLFRATGEVDFNVVER